MKKIVIDARFFGPSHTGLGRYTQSLITAIYHQPQKFDYTLLAPLSKQHRLKKLFPRFEIYPVNARHYSLAEQFIIPKILNQLKPDLVHFLHFNVPCTYSQPFIVTIHDLIKHHSKGLATTTQWPIIYPLKRLGYHLTIRHAITRAKLICTPTQWVKKDILSFYSVKPGEIIVTPEAAQSVFFKPISSKPNDLIPDKPYLIFTGNAYPHKNLIQLIKGVQAYRLKSKLDLQLIIITAKDIFYQRLRCQARQLQAFNFLRIKGYSTDRQIQSLYYNSIAFITPSLQEGFGLPGLEALASKAIVLSSDCTCLPEVYQQSTHYFNPNNLSSMVQAITWAVNLSGPQRRRLIDNNYRYAQQFSWEKTAKATVKAYETCLCL
ncbi:MAG: glycosyltransferase family 1 protein [Candidatus Beckwithbacteria bacterium]